MAGTNTTKIFSVVIVCRHTWIRAGSQLTDTVGCSVAQSLWSP